MTTLHREQLVQTFNDIKEMKELHFEKEKERKTQRFRETAKFVEPASANQQEVDAQSPRKVSEKENPCIVNQESEQKRRMSQSAHYKRGSLSSENKIQSNASEHRLTFFEQGNNMPGQPDEAIDNREEVMSREMETTENFYQVNSNDKV